MIPLSSLSITWVEGGSGARSNGSEQDVQVLPFASEGFRMRRLDSPQPVQRK